MLSDRFEFITHELCGIHLNDKGQQKLTAAMAEVFNKYVVTGQSFHILTIITST